MCERSPERCAKVRRRAERMCQRASFSLSSKDICLNRSVDTPLICVVQNNHRFWCFALDLTIVDHFNWSLSFVVLLFFSLFLFGLETFISVLYGSFSLLSCRIFFFLFLFFFLYFQSNRNVRWPSHTLKEISKTRCWLEGMKQSDWIALKRLRRRGVRAEDHDTSAPTLSFELGYRCMIIRKQCSQPDSHHDMVPFSSLSPDAAACSSVSKWRKRSLNKPSSHCCQFPLSTFYPCMPRKQVIHSAYEWRTTLKHNTAGRAALINPAWYSWLARRQRPTCSYFQRRWTLLVTWKVHFLA